MIYRALIFFFLVQISLFPAGSISAAEVAGEFRVEFVISEPCSLVRFLDTASGRDHTTAWFADWYLKQIGNEAEAEKASLEKYKSDLNKMDNHYHFKDCTNRENNTSQYIAALAAGCKNLDELLDLLKRRLEAADYLIVEAAYKHYAPVYHKLVWEPCFPRLEKQLVEFKEEAGRVKFSEKLVEVQKFMNSPWKRSMPFTVVFVPLPKTADTHTHGESIGSIQFVELLWKHDFKSQSDVIFHEICHTFWGAKKDLNKIQHEFAAIGGSRAYSELNEGLATALGQGWFPVTAFGAEIEKSWYVDDVINGNAHALYPLVSEYIRKSKTFDVEFVRRATAAFNEKFPSAASDMRLTGEINIYADSLQNRAEFKDALMGSMSRLHGFSIYTPVNRSRLLKGCRRESRCVVMLSREKLQKLNLGFSEKQLALLNKSSNEALSLKLNDADVILLIADKPEQQEQMLFALLKKGEWPQSIPQD